MRKILLKIQFSTSFHALLSILRDIKKKENKNVINRNFLMLRIRKLTRDDFDEK